MQSQKPKDLQPIKKNLIHLYKLKSDIPLHQTDLHPITQDEGILLSNEYLHLYSLSKTATCLRLKARSKHFDTTYRSSAILSFQTLNKFNMITTKKDASTYFLSIYLSMSRVAMIESSLPSNLLFSCPFNQSMFLIYTSPATVAHQRSSSSDKSLYLKIKVLDPSQLGGMDSKIGKSTKKTSFWISDEVITGLSPQCSVLKIGNSDMAIASKTGISVYRAQVSPDYEIQISKIQKLGWPIEFKVSGPSSSPSSDQAIVTDFKMGVASKFLLVGLCIELNFQKLVSVYSITSPGLSSHPLRLFYVVKDLYIFARTCHLQVSRYKFTRKSESLEEETVVVLWGLGESSQGVSLISGRISSPKKEAKEQQRQFLCCQSPILPKTITSDFQLDSCKLVPSLHNPLKIDSSSRFLLKYLKIGAEFDQPETSLIYRMDIQLSRLLNLMIPVARNPGSNGEEISIDLKAYTSLPQDTDLSKDQDANGSKLGVQSEELGESGSENFLPAKFGGLRRTATVTEQYPSLINLTSSRGKSVKWQLGRTGSYNSITTQSTITSAVAKLDLGARNLDRGRSSSTNPTYKKSIFGTKKKEQTFSPKSKKNIKSKNSSILCPKKPANKSVLKKLSLNSSRRDKKGSKKICPIGCQLI